MTELFSDNTPGRISYYQAILEADGIQTFVKNQNVSGTEGMLHIFAPILCVVNDQDANRAKQLINDNAPSEVPDTAPDITCQNCKEPNPANFAKCWNCETELTLP
ncbi:MAG: DUF2007 domain-containing protein [Luteolibacter sp.]